MYPSSNREKSRCKLYLEKARPAVEVDSTICPCHSLQLTMGRIVFLFHKPIFSMYFTRDVHSSAVDIGGARAPPDWGFRKKDRKRNK